jgi:hypothetical protein
MHQFLHFHLAYLICQAIGACISFTNLRTATESLDQKIFKKASLNNLWFNAINRGTYPKGTGVVQTTFTMVESEPPDLDSWELITLDANGQPGSSVSGPLVNCPTDYVNTNVGYYPRTYGPKRLKIRGPVICRDQLTYQHNVVDFLNGYFQKLVKNAQRRLEFVWRADYLNFADIWVSGTKYSGPNAIATIPPSAITSDITQGQLDLLAQDLITSGATEPDSDGYIMLGGAGYLFTLEINAMASQRILKNNRDRREDARYAMANELWRRIGATTVIGNFRHACTFMAPRFNVVNGVLTQVQTFLDASNVTSNGVSFTPQYLAAPYEAAIPIVKSAFEAEIVTPENWRYETTRNYMGEWQWIEGGERIQPGCFDPEHNMGQHYARFEYAPKPLEPYHAKAIIYARPPVDVASSDLYAYAYAE